MPKSFPDLVSLVCKKRLVESGFRCASSGILVKLVNDDFLGWVGLNRGRVDGHVRINPFVGIHCVPVMRMKQELKGERYQKGRTATFAIHLGEICPDVEQFIFERNKGIDEEAERLASTVQEFGWNWIEANANYNSLLPLLQTRFERLGGYPESLAAGYFVSGQRLQAQSVLEERADIFLTRMASMLRSILISQSHFCLVYKANLITAR